jgi:hypothetical protein
MPNRWVILADAIVGFHVAYVGAVVVGFVAILIGGAMGARWVRGFALRAAHLGMIALVCVESFLGASCPLTIWENAARVCGGEAGYEGDFIGRCLDAMIFYNAPPAVFTAIYIAFAAAVLASWILIPVDRPNWRSGRGHRT